MYNTIDAKSQPKLKEKETELGLAAKIAYVASHDLRAPVNHIKSYLKLLERDLGGISLNERAQQDLQAIEACANRMELLIQALGCFANVPLTVKPALVHLNQCLKSAVSQLAPLFQTNNVVLEVGELPCVQGDADQITALLVVLIQNAIMYNHSNPIWLECFIQREHGDLIFCIKDNGDAIPHVHQKQIFEPAKRLHSLRDYPGAGMGLAIAKRIVEAHGGSIWVESSGVNGEGSVFKLILEESRPHE